MAAADAPPAPKAEGDYPNYDVDLGEAACRHLRLPSAEQPPLGSRSSGERRPPIQSALACFPNSRPREPSSQNG